MEGNVIQNTSFASLYIEDGFTNDRQMSSNGSETDDDFSLMINSDVSRSSETSSSKNSVCSYLFVNSQNEDSDVKQLELGNNLFIY